MIIYRHTGEVWKEDLKVLDTSFHEDSLQTERRLYVEYVLAEHEEVPELCYTEWEGVRYTLYKPAEVRKISTREYRYTLTLNPSEITLNDILLKFVAGDKKTKFTMTASPKEFAELLASNVDGWRAGECIDADPKVISFKDDSIMSAAQRIAKEFETEVLFSNNTFSFHKLQLFTDAPLVLSYRNGLKSEIQVSPDGNEPAIGRLYVNGGERNIDRTKYNSSTLHLPKNGRLSVGAQTFITDALGMYISLEGDSRLHTAERAFDATGVYPSRVGIVSSVEAKTKQGSDGEYTDYDIIDKDNDIDYSQYRIGGETMTVVFQSGRLAGRSFAIATKDDKLVGYDHSEKRFMLVRQEYDGVMMPEPNTFYPSVGDKYAVFGCSLPPQYITKAENEMLQKGAEYIAERLHPRKLFKGDLDGLWAKRHWGDVGHKLVLGATVQLTDPELGATQDVRISGIRRNLNSKYTPRLTFSNAPFIVGSINATIGTIQAKEVRIEETERDIRKLEQRTYSDITKTKELIEGLDLEKFTDSISPKTLSTIQGIFAVPELQFQFVRGLKDSTATQFIYIWRKGGTELYVPRQYLAKLKKGKTLSATKEYDIYEIPEFTYSFKDNEHAKHLYAHIGDGGNKFMLSDDPLPLTEENNLVGLVTGGAGNRQVSTLYGFTEITPGQIATDRIRSTNDKVDINLLDGEFIIGDPSGKTCLAYIGGVLYQKGMMIGVGQDATTIEDALKDQEKKREEAIAAEKSAREQATSTLSQQLKALEGKTATEAQLNTLTATINSKFQEVQKQVDGEVSNWFGNGAPSASKKPESEWTTNARKARHIGDTYTSTDKEGEFAGISWRYTTKFTWEQIADNQISKALKLASDAKSTADGKSTTYYHKPNGYQEGDSWLLQEDTEIAGTTYKAGTIVYAHATREQGFVQADWRTNAYITQQAIDDTRTSPNLLLNSKSPQRKKGQYVTYHLSRKIAPGKYRLSFDVDVITPPIGNAFGFYIGYRTSQEVNGYFEYDKSEKSYSKIIEVKGTPPDDILDLYLYTNSRYKNPKTEGVGEAIFSNVMLTEGTLNHSYEEAPEDLIAEIDNVKGEVNKFTTSVTNLRNEVTTTFADGIVDKAEARAIEKYINIVNTEKEGLEAVYNKLFANSYLSGEPKRSLMNAKVSYFGAVENLLRSINSAISDGKATASEKDDVDRKYRSYKDVLSTFRAAIEQANKAVQKAIEDSAKGYTDQVAAEFNNHPPRINQSTKNWEVWRIVAGVGRYVDTGDTSVGDDGKSPKIVDGYWYIWDGTAYVSSRIRAVGPKGDKGDPGEKGPKGDKGDPGRDADMEEVNSLKRGLTDANTLISTLQTITNKLKEGKLDASKFQDLSWLTDAFLKGNTQKIGGVVLSKSIILSNEGDKITSLLSGYDGLGGGAFARAGIKNFGTDNETANLELFHNGGAKLGDMYVVPDPDGDNDRIEFREGDGDEEHKYLQIGGKAATEHEMLTGSTIIENRLLPNVAESEEGTYVIDKFRSRENNLFVKYIAKVHVTADAISQERPGYLPGIDTGGGKNKYLENSSSVTATAKVTVTSSGGEAKYSNTENFVKASAYVPSGNEFKIDTKSGDVDVSITVPSNKITRGDLVEFSLVVEGEGQFSVTTSSVYKYAPRDTSKSLVAVTKDKLSFFFSRQKYILFNYLSEWLIKVVGNVMVQGKMEVTDELKAGHIDTSGAVLCGGRVNSNGGVQTSFGKYKNENGGSSPRVSYSYNTRTFTVHHSIGNTNYVPFVNSYGDVGSPMVSDIDSYSFKVYFTLQSDRNGRWAVPFTYICYKGD